jgi:PAS domain S-box-containing protein
MAKSPASEQIALLKSILESSTEYSIVAKDLKGMILAWNEGARRVYGYDAVDVVGCMHAFQLHDPDDVASGKAQGILDEVLATGKWEGELTSVRKDGTRFSAHATMTLRRDAEGRPIGFTMVSRDLTESQRLERELRKSGEKVRHLLEATPAATDIIDAQGCIVFVNALVRAVREVVSGHRHLSPPRVDRHAVLSAREREVLPLAAQGSSLQQIASALSISRRTVETHRANMMRKLGLHSQTELVRHAMREGILPLQ